MNNRKSFRHSGLAAELSAWFSRAAPDWLYLFAFPKLLSIANRSRRGLNVKFKKDKHEMFWAIDSNYGSLAFYERTRLHFYRWPGGVRDRLNSISEKYQSGRVVIDDGDIVIDVGANIGEFALACARKAERVIAIEPDPVPFRALQINAAAYQRIVPIKVGLSNRPGRLSFYLAPKTADSSFVKPDGPSTQVTIDVVTLDELIDEYGLPRLDFLKVEAEGWEPEVLKGAERAMQMTRKIAVDAGPERNGLPTDKEVRAILEGAGFKVSQRASMVFGIRD